LCAEGGIFSAKIREQKDTRWRFVVFQVRKSRPGKPGVFTQWVWRGKNGRGRLRDVPTHPSTKKVEGWGTRQQRIIQTSQEMVKRSHGKDGKQKDVFHFPTALLRLSI
jgi:hypothetical protein